MALTEAVGPIETTEVVSAEENAELLKIPEIAAGFLYGLTDDLQLEYLQTCMLSSSELLQYMSEFFKDLEQMHLIQAFMDLQKFIFHLQEDVQPCTDMHGDLKKLESWAEIFAYPEVLGETVTVSTFLNRAEIKTQIGTYKTDVAAEEYFQAGWDLANTAVFILGDAPTEIVGNVAEENIDITVRDFNHLLAGFIYGMTTQNHLTEIEACYTGASEMEQELV